MLGECKEFACREPFKTLATAFGAGLLLNIFPTRWVVGTVTVVGALLLRPTLLSLGVIKAIELCIQNKNNLLKP
jgi:hypothetical protein